MIKGGKDVIHINFFAAHIDDVYFPQLNVIGDISSSIRNITKNIYLDRMKHHDYSYFKRVRDEVDFHLSKYFDDNRFPILPQTISEYFAGCIKS